MLGPDREKPNGAHDCRVPLYRNNSRHTDAGLRSRIRRVDVTPERKNRNGLSRNEKGEKIARNPKSRR